MKKPLKNGCLNRTRVFLKNGIGTRLNYTNGYDSTNPNRDLTGAKLAEKKDEARAIIEADIKKQLSDLDSTGLVSSYAALDKRYNQQTGGHIWFDDFEGKPGEVSKG
jgi:hypothetical protein